MQFQMLFQNGYKACGAEGYTCGLMVRRTSLREPSGGRGSFRNPESMHKGSLQASRQELVED